MSWLWNNQNVTLISELVTLSCAAKRQNRFGDASDTQKFNLQITWCQNWWRNLYMAWKLRDSSKTQNQENGQTAAKLGIVGEIRGRALWGKIRSFWDINDSLTRGLGSGQASERANEWAQWSVRAKQAGWSRRMSEWCERTTKRTSEWPSTYVWILGFTGP